MKKFVRLNTLEISPFNVPMDIDMLMVDTNTGEISIVNSNKDIIVNGKSESIAINELSKKVSQLQKTITIISAGGTIQSETEYITNTIPVNGTITTSEKSVELFSYNPTATDVKNATITGNSITINKVTIPKTEVTVAGSLFNLNSKTSVIIQNSTINTNSTMSSVFTIHAGTDLTSLNTDIDGSIKLTNIVLNGGIKTSNSNIWNLDQSTNVEIKDCEFNLSGYNGIMIGQNHKGILPKTINIENCNFNLDAGTFKMFALNIFATQDDAIVNIKNCNFKNVTSCIRFGNSTAASGVIVNIEDCHFGNNDIDVENGGFMSFENFQSASEYPVPQKLENESDADYAKRKCLAMLQYDDEVNRFGNGKMTINFINCTFGKTEIKPFNFTSNDYSKIFGSSLLQQCIYMVNWCYAKKYGNTNVSATVYPTYEATTTDADGNIVYPQYILDAWGELGRPQNVGPMCWPTFNISYKK